MRSSRACKSGALKVDRLKSFESSLVAFMLATDMVSRFVTGLGAKLVKQDKTDRMLITDQMIRAGQPQIACVPLWVLYTLENVVCREEVGLALTDDLSDDRFVQGVLFRRHQGPDGEDL